jgi:hypothetical protein
LTGSAFGFVGYIDQHTGYLVSPTLTRNIWAECGVMDKQIVFERFTGLWVARSPAAAADQRPGARPASDGDACQVHRDPALPAAPSCTARSHREIALANPSRDYTPRP